MVRHDQHVHARLQPGRSELGVRAFPVRVDGVDMQRDDQFFHGSKIIPLLECSSIGIVGWWSGESAKVQRFLLCHFLHFLD